MQQSDLGDYDGDGDDFDLCYTRIFFARFLDVSRHQNHSRLALAVAGKIFALFRLSLSQWSPENVIFSPL